MSTKHLLRHIHFQDLVPFQAISKLQDILVAQNLAHKASPLTTPVPLPTVVSFTPFPVYTFGRRDLPTTFAPAFIEKLQEPLAPKDTQTIRNILKCNQHLDTFPDTPWTRAEIVPTLRGGLTTFHGPGQLVIYPILDLKSPLVRNSLPDTSEPNPYSNGLDVRSYISLLEATTVDVLKYLDITAHLTADPGVWTQPRHRDVELYAGQRREIPRKIAAVGVHLRRNITSYGLAINNATDLRWFDRIVPCGLVGKGVTSIFEQTRPIWRRKIAKEDPFGDHVKLLNSRIATSWVRDFTKKIWNSPLVRETIPAMMPWWYEGKVESVDFHLGRRSDFHNDLGPFEKDGLVQYIRVGSGVEKPGGVETLAKFLETGEMDDPTVKIKRRKRGPMLISFKDHDAEFEEAMMAYNQGTTDGDLDSEIDDKLLKSRRKGFRSYKIAFNQGRTDEDLDPEIDNRLLESRRKGFRSYKNLGIVGEGLDPETENWLLEWRQKGWRRYKNKRKE
jgi:lipoate-protein ligase B